MILNISLKTIYKYYIKNYMFIKKYLSKYLSKYSEKKNKNMFVDNIWKLIKL